MTSKWKSQGMEVNNVQQETMVVIEIAEERSEAQHMEEEPESINIRYLDLLGLEQACKKKEYDKILERQLEILEVILFREPQQRSLCIHLGSKWDGKNIPKDNKKRRKENESSKNPPHLGNAGGIGKMFQAYKVLQSPTQ